MFIVKFFKAIFNFFKRLFSIKPVDRVPAEVGGYYGGYGYATKK